MRIKTTTLAAGPDGVRPADTELEVSEEEGLAMIAAGSALLVEHTPPAEVADSDADPEDDPADAGIETASMSGEETAAARTGRSDGRERGE